MNFVIVHSFRVWPPLIYFAFASSLDSSLPKISEEVACFTSALENPCIAKLKVPHLSLFRRKLTKGNVLSDVRVMTYQILEVEKTSGDINEVHSYYYPELELPAKLSDPITVYLKNEN